MIQSLFNFYIHNKMQHIQLLLSFLLLASSLQSPRQQIKIKYTILYVPQIEDYQATFEIANSKASLLFYPKKSQDYYVQHWLKNEHKPEEEYLSSPVAPQKNYIHILQQNLQPKPQKSISKIGIVFVCLFLVIMYVQKRPAARIQHKSFTQMQETNILMEQ